MQATKLNIILFGYHGKMGEAIRHQIPLFFPNVDVYDGKESVPNSALTNAVCIDFSNPMCLPQVLQYQLPCVIGTTGYSESELQQIHDYAKHHPVFFDSNFSLGIQVLKILAETASKHLKNFDLTILESHHKSKKDKPSGTAKSLQKCVASLYDQEIPIVSVRGGGIRGQHQLIYSGSDEILTINHEVLDRKVFAQGALQAIQWILQKKPSQGFFNMRNLFL